MNSVVLVRRLTTVFVDSRHVARCVSAKRRVTLELEHCLSNGGRRYTFGRIAADKEENTRWATTNREECYAGR